MKKKYIKQIKFWNSPEELIPDNPAIYFLLRFYFYVYECFACV